MSDRFERVLIAVKPQGHGLPLSVEHAQSLGQGLGAEIALVAFISDAPSASSSSFAGTEPGEAWVLPVQSRGEALQELEALAQPLRDAGLSVTTHVSTELPVSRGILEQVAQWRADLVVLGVHEPMLGSGTHLTETDWQLMRLCPCPLLLVREPGVKTYATIVATVDPLLRHAEPENLDAAVLASADEFRRSFGARLSVVNVYPNPEDFEIVSGVEVEPGVFYGSENVEAAHSQAVGDLIEACGISDADTIMRPGAPAAVISEIAGELKADLVVVGSISRGRIERAILGSTAEAVVSSALCDVLLVKPAS